MRSRPFRRASVSLVVLATLMATMIPSTGGADTLRPGTTILVSTHVNGAPADGGSPSITPDGRYIAFDSWDQLTPEDTDQLLDIYRKDMVTGQTILVTTNVTGAYNMKPSISGDGNKVAYLAAGCSFLISSLPSCSGFYAYVKNISTSAMVRVSDPTGRALSVSLSRDGRWSTSYIEENDSVRLDIADTTSGIPVWGFPCGDCSAAESATLSANGRYVAFESMFANAPGGTGGWWDVYWHDRDADNNGVFDEIGKTLTKHVGIRPEGDSPDVRSPIISDDGSKVAFIAGDNLIQGAAPIVNRDRRAYIRDLSTENTTLVSQSSFGVPSAGVMSPNLAMSSDGRYVSFYSLDPEMVAGDTNPFEDVFVRDTASRTTHLVSAMPDGSQFTGDHSYPSMSSSGRFVAFESSRTRDSKIERRLYLRDTSVPCPVICPESTVADIVHGFT